MDVESALLRLPIFPLPGAVLLPHSVVPLHIFEPRYRKMTRDCEAGGKVLALANIPDEDAAGEKPPRVLPVIGVGQLTRVEPMPDGRFNILVRGAVRARIAGELPSGEPYRLVRAHVLAPEPGEAESLPVRKAAEGLRRLILALCAAKPGPETAAVAQLAARAADPGDLADLVAGALLQAPRERQAVLEAVRLVERLGLAQQAAASMLAHSPSPASAPN